MGGSLQLQAQKAEKAGLHLRSPTRMHVLLYIFTDSPEGGVAGVRLREDGHVQLVTELGVAAGGTLQAGSIPHYHRRYAARRHGLFWLVYEERREVRKRSLGKKVRTEKK